MPRQAAPVAALLALALMSSSALAADVKVDILLVNNTSFVVHGNVHEEIHPDLQPGTSQSHISYFAIPWTGSDARVYVLTLKKNETDFCRTVIDVLVSSGSALTNCSDRKAENFGTMRCRVITGEYDKYRCTTNMYAD